MARVVQTPGDRRESIKRENAKLEEIGKPNCSQISSPRKPDGGEGGARVTISTEEGVAEIVEGVSRTVVLVPGEAGQKSTTPSTMSGSEGGGGKKKR